MNKTTKKIIEEKFGKAKPIYDRAREIIESKDINLNFLKQMYNKEEEIRSSQWTSSVCKIEKFDKRKFDEWILKKMEWYQDKSTKISKISENSELVELKGLKMIQKNTSFDKSILTNYDKDQIFERLNKATVGNIKLSKLVKHHLESFAPSPFVRSPRFKKDLRNRSLNVSLNAENVKKGKFYSSASSPQRNNVQQADVESNNLIGTNSSTLLNRQMIKTIDENGIFTEEILSINKVNKQKFSYFRSNSVCNKKTVISQIYSPKFNF